MTLSELVERWSARRDEWTRLGIQLSGAAVADEILTDLAELVRQGRAESVLLADAAQLSGYSRDHLRKLVAAGKLEIVGTAGRIRLRRGDLPEKARTNPLPTESGSGTFPPVGRDVVSQIMRSVA